MNTRYVLIDHENVQPKDLALLDGQPLRVIVFLGASQKSVSTDLAMALQARGANGQYVKISAKAATRSTLISRSISASWRRRIPPHRSTSSRRTAVTIR